MFLDAKHFDCDPWHDPKSGRHDVFLPRHLCTQPHRLQQPQIEKVIYTKTDFIWDYKIPSDEIIDWMRAREVNFVIHSSWRDACGFFITNPTPEIIVEMKLTFDGISI